MRRLDRTKRKTIKKITIFHFKEVKMSFCFDFTLAKRVDVDDHVYMEHDGCITSSVTLFDNVFNKCFVYLPFRKTEHLEPLQRLLREGTEIVALDKQKTRWFFGESNQFRRFLQTIPNAIDLPDMPISNMDNIICLKTLSRMVRGPDGFKTIVNFCDEDGRDILVDSVFKDTTYRKLQKRLPYRDDAFKPDIKDIESLTEIQHFKLEWMRNCVVVIKKKMRAIFTNKIALGQYALAHKNTIDMNEKGVPIDMELLFKSMDRIEKEPKLGPTEHKVKKINKSLIESTVKHGFSFWGAVKTGRWTSSGVQFQNLPKETSKITQTNVRELVAKKGKKLYVVDLKAIEPRVAFYILKNFVALKEVHEGKDIYGEIGKVNFIALMYGAKPPLIPRDIYEKFHIQYPEFKNKYEEIQDEITRCFYEKDKFYWNCVGLRYLNYGKIRKIPVAGNIIGYIYSDPNNKDKKLYAPLVFQHTCQAFAHYIFLIKFNKFVSMGYDVRMVIHDELVALVDKGLKKEDIDKDFDRAGKDFIKTVYPSFLLDFKSKLVDNYAQKEVKL